MSHFWGPPLLIDFLIWLDTKVTIVTARTNKRYWFLLVVAIIVLSRVCFWLRVPGLYRLLYICNDVYWSWIVSCPYWLISVSSTYICHRVDTCTPVLCLFTSPPIGGGRGIVMPMFVRVFAKFHHNAPCNIHNAPCNIKLRLSWDRLSVFSQNFKV